MSETDISLWYPFFFFAIPIVYGIYCEKNECGPYQCGNCDSALKFTNTFTTRVFYCDNCRFEGALNPMHMWIRGTFEFVTYLGPRALNGLRLGWYGASARMQLGVVVLGAYLLLESITVPHLAAIAHNAVQRLVWNGRLDVLSDWLVFL